MSTANVVQEAVLHEHRTPDTMEIEKIEEAQQSLPIRYDRGGNPLEPQPSADPHDPLNFPTWQKWSLMAILSYWSFLGTMNLIIVVRATENGLVRSRTLTLMPVRGLPSSN